MELLTDAILAIAQSPWVLIAIVGICLIDGFFPPVPSETLVVATAAVAAAAGNPLLIVGIVLAAALGAVIGDNIAYSLGRAVGVERWRWMRTDRVRAVVEWARRGLHRRTAALVLTARYIPVGRIAVNMTAGATGLPRRRFLPLTVLAGISWAVYSTGIGVLAGVWLKENPLLGAAIGVVIAIALGLVIDRVGERRTRRRAERERLEECDERDGHADSGPLPVYVAY
ncbi:membrane protein DedA with SNARE-associated domain [Diaminobutyricimonas aerilata]|uniref:Membrane protein DedA with SNARE-associated domain n=1 Tax=Diaminobutyricimonas aerilata TaxID=1162967 RepID=A0A2M9CMH3_9MICO|nr:VTT domain-containing protein [Diaminobutyricimonas aerilata]PJJ73089.1 membrane protein DedA with SNARE-associated domain [Diaminobutyricimonas aerilata]